MLAGQTLIAPITLENVIFLKKQLVCRFSRTRSRATASRRGCCRGLVDSTVASLAGDPGFKSQREKKTASLDCPTQSYAIH